MNALLLLALVGLSYATPCWLDAEQRWFGGECSTSNECTGTGALWVSSHSWRGTKQAWGCEAEPWNVRCCYIDQSRQEQTTRAWTQQTQTEPQATRTETQAQTQAQTQSQTQAQGGNVGAVERAWLQLHNEERRCYGVPELTWSDELEHSARVYAAKCQFEHSSRSERNGAGENLAAGTGRRDAVGLAQGWIDEQFDWNCQRNTNTGVVGHYTQVIWASTQRLGCASIVCNSNSPFGSGFGSAWTNVVCHYDPPGNYIGRRAVEASQCGSCARSARTAEQLWAPADLQICVPSSGNSADGEQPTDSKCVCPIGDSEQPCNAAEANEAQLEACDVEPVPCGDEFLYARPPECNVPVCSSSSAANAAASATAALIGVAALL